MLRCAHCTTVWGPVAAHLIGCHCPTTFLHRWPGNYAASWALACPPPHPPTHPHPAELEAKKLGFFVFYNVKADFDRQAGMGSICSSWPADSPPAAACTFTQLCVLSGAAWAGENQPCTGTSLVTLDRDHVVLEDLEEFLDSEKDAKSAMVGCAGRGWAAARVQRRLPCGCWTPVGFVLQ